MLIQITQMMRIRIHNTDLNDPNIKVNRTNSYQKNLDIAHVVARDLGSTIPRATWNFE